MRSTTVLLAAAAAFANSALAQVAGFAVFSTPATDEVVQAGKPYVVKWTAGKYTGPVTLSIIGGETQGTQIPLGDIATHIEVSDNQYKWNVDCSLGAAKIYGLKITSEKDEDLFQWSFPFKISNKGCDATSSVVPTPTPGSTTSYPTSTPTTPASSYVVTSTPSSHSSKTTVETTAESSTAVSTDLTTVVTTTKAVTTSSPATTTTPTSTSTTLPTAAATRVAGSFALAGIAAVAALAL